MRKVFGDERAVAAPPWGPTSGIGAARACQRVAFVCRAALLHPVGVAGRRRGSVRLLLQAVKCNISGMALHEVLAYIAKCPAVVRTALATD